MLYKYWLQVVHWCITWRVPVSRRFSESVERSCKDAVNLTPQALTLAMGADYYKTLGIDKNASDDDIKRAYKKMVAIIHVRLSAPMLITLHNRP
jgi:hypothetical protein